MTNKQGVILVNLGTPAEANTGWGKNVLARIFDGSTCGGHSAFYLVAFIAWFGIATTL